MVVTIAHRGASKFAPENTIPAFQKAIEMGLDYVEIDVRSTSDGHLVLSHDSSVDRMTDGSGKISDMTFAQIRDLDAGASFDGGFSGVKIPTLAETLEVCRGNIGIYLDLKNAPPRSVVEELRRYEMIQDTAVYSDVEVLSELKSLEPELWVMPGPGGWLSVPGVVGAIVRGLPAEVIDSNIVDWSSRAVEEVHAAGAQVWVDTLGLMDNEDGMRRALQIGVDGIDTDHPDVLLEVLRDV